MLEVMKSEMMIGVMLMIMAVAYFSAIQTSRLDVGENDKLIMMKEVIN